MRIRLAVIGIGKIARDEHLPAISKNQDFELVAVAGPGANAGPIRAFDSHVALLNELRGQIDAVAICTPPMARYEIARDCLLEDQHVLLEKPPTITLGQIGELEQLARDRRLCLFTAWHARYNKAVMAAAELLSKHRIERLEIEWREDVRQWHPGQTWIWEAGGFGVLDAGINAISIASLISPAPLLVESAEFVVPANMQTPIAASLVFYGNQPPQRWRATLDWRPTQTPIATLKIQTQGGMRVALLDGGASLYVNEKLVALGDKAEYPQIYERFATIIRDRLCDVDREPLRVVADAFLIAHRTAGVPFTG